MQTTRASNSAPLRIGVVGTGRWGSVLLREASRLEDLEVLAAISPSAPIKSLPVAGVVGFAGLSQAVAQTGITAVVVAVPRSESARTVTAALDLGLHVLAEKPLCMSANECDYLYEKARAAERVLRVDYTYLFHEEIQGLLTSLRGQTAPDLEMRVNDPDRRATPEEVVWGWGPHLFSLIHTFGLSQSGGQTTEVLQTQLTHDLEGWTLTVNSASGGTSRLILRHSGSKERTLRLTMFGNVRTVDLLRHAGTSPILASLQHFAEQARRANEGPVPVSDEPLTWAVTAALSAVAY